MIDLFHDAELTIQDENDNIISHFVIRIEYRVTFGQPESGRFGPIEFYDPVSGDEVEPLKYSAAEPWVEKFGDAWVEKNRDWLVEMAREEVKRVKEDV